MNLGGRIKTRLEELGWKQAELLLHVDDLEPATLSALIKRDSKSCQLDTEIASALGVELKWLRTGEGNKLAQKPIQEAAVKQLSTVQQNYDQSDSSTRELVDLLLEASTANTLDAETSAALLTLTRQLVHAKPLTNQTKLRNHLQNRDK